MGEGINPLDQLFEELKKINYKLESIYEQNKKLLENQISITNGFGELDPMALLTLPASLRKTVMALYKLEKATANDLSEETKRLRAVESASANQLVRLGYVKKTRKGRDVYFFIEPQLELKK
jgi:ArsR family transcriptional regulator, lead/cadmium/zinc/bismuth-responsive transcriptional repressor